MKKNIRTRAKNLEQTHFEKSTPNRSAPLTGLIINRLPYLSCPGKLYSCYVIFARALGSISVVFLVWSCISPGLPGLDYDWKASAVVQCFSSLSLQVTIRNAIVHDARFNKGLYIKYKPFKETEFTSTSVVKATLEPEFNHSQVFHFDEVKQELLDWFDSGCISFQLFGRQEDSDPDSTRTRMTTKVLGLSLVCKRCNNSQQHVTTCNRVCKRTQHVTSNSVAPVCAGLKLKAILTLTSPIDINLPTRSALVLVTKDYFASLVTNFKNKNNVSSMSQRFHGPIFFFCIFQVTFFPAKVEALLHLNAHLKYKILKK